MSLLLSFLSMRSFFEKSSGVAIMTSKWRTKMATERETSQLVVQKIAHDSSSCSFTNALAMYRISLVWRRSPTIAPEQLINFYHDWVFPLENVRNCSNSNIFPVQLIKRNQQAGLVYWGTMHVVPIRRRWTPCECVSGHLAKALQARDCPNASAAPRDAMRKWRPSRTGRSSTQDVNCIRLIGTWN